MPRLIKHKDVQINRPLYEALASLFRSWGGIGELPNDSDDNGKRRKKPVNELAKLIAHQSALEERIRAGGLNRSQSSGERKTLVERYLKALTNARKIWMEMENDDQRSLSQSLSEIDSGHAIVDVLGLEPFLTSFKPTKDVAQWRQKALKQHKHESWGLDTEMLDLLIGAAQQWITEKAPESHSKIDPTLYAVIYMGEQCQTFGLEPSPAPSSQFTQVVDAYFKHTNTGRDSSDRTNFKDLIQKANSIRERSPEAHLIPDESWFLPHPATQTE
ncbi:hypothetical protein [Stutzerimonas kirkiae]|uniref:hypothetical protein n=1 Tax=Stutzerimonas kirkiae TaxID=2211392 RepID=UPI0010384A6C|nr:hypothetical protein [Stutzerimonas kirkiae]TBV11343.1 hypothetical protein DNK08_03575 [Stutzerimonas kirkiae]